MVFKASINGPIFAGKLGLWFVTYLLDTNGISKLTLHIFAVGWGIATRKIIAAIFCMLDGVVVQRAGNFGIVKLLSMPSLGWLMLLWEGVTVVLFHGVLCDLNLLDGNFLLFHD